MPSSSIVTLGKRSVGSSSLLSSPCTVSVGVEVDGDTIRQELLTCFGIEIGTSFGPLHGKIWRIGTMGFNARQECVLTTLAALEAVLLKHKAKVSPGQAVIAAMLHYAK